MVLKLEVKPLNLNNMQIVMGTLAQWGKKDQWWENETQPHKAE